MKCLLSFSSLLRLPRNGFSLFERRPFHPTKAREEKPGEGNRAVECCKVQGEEIRGRRQIKAGLRQCWQLRFSICLACWLTPATPAVHAADNELTSAEKKDGWLLLFDGQTLNGWMTSEAKPSRRPVEQSCMNPHQCGHYMMVHTQQWSNFVLTLDFKISKGCNSGIFVRTASLTPRLGKDVGYNGIEVQILDSTTADYYDTGAIYDLSRPTKNAMKPVGDWNHIQITCAGNIIDVVLNGEKVNHMDLDQFTEPNKRPDGTTHKFDVAYNKHPRTGYIGLQDHGADCWFKNIKLRPLS